MKELEREHWIIIILVVILSIVLFVIKMFSVWHRVHGENATTSLHVESYATTRMSSTSTATTTTSTTSSSIRSGLRSTIFEEVFVFMMSGRAEDEDEGISVDDKKHDIDNNDDGAGGGGDDDYDNYHGDGGSVSLMDVSQSLVCCSEEELCPVNEKRVRFSEPDECCRLSTS